MAFEIGFTDQLGTTGFAHKELLLKIKALAELNGWVTLRYKIDDPVSHELILKGEGLDGAQEIFIGFRTYDSDTADYYNLAVAGFIGYVPGNVWSAQPGIFESGIPAHNQRVDYVMQANAQRINIGLKVGTPVYESGGAGFILRYSKPGQFPYPIYVSGMLNGATATRYSDTAHTMGWKGNRVNFRLRFLDGTWKQPLTHPWNAPNVGGVTNQLRDTAGQYPIMPITLCEATPNIFGILDGIGYVSNFNNTVESVIQAGGTPVTDDPLWTMQERADAIITAGGVPWVCLQDVGRTSFNDYFAMRLD